MDARFSVTDDLPIRFTGDLWHRGDFHENIKYRGGYAWSDFLFYNMRANLTLDSDSLWDYGPFSWLVRV